MGRSIVSRVVRDVALVIVARGLVEKKRRSFLLLLPGGQGRTCGAAASDGDQGTHENTGDTSSKQGVSHHADVYTVKEAGKSSQENASLES